MILGLVAMLAVVEGLRPRVHKKSLKMEKAFEKFKSDFPDDFAARKRSNTIHSLSPSNAAKRDLYERSEQDDAQSDEEKRDAMWETYKRHFEREYTRAEESERKKNFIKTYEEVQKHNKEADEGKSGFREAINYLADKSDEEKEKLNGVPLNDKRKRSLNVEVSRSNDIAKRVPVPPATFSYQDLNEVSGVKDQGGCGSCVTFAVAGQLEAMNKWQSGEMEDLSEQQLLDCNHLGSYCNGTWPWKTGQTLFETGYIGTEDCYPYLTASDQVCDANDNCKASTTFEGWKQYEVTAGAGNTFEENMKHILYTYSPLVVCINIIDSFYNYANGVYDPANCWVQHGLHAVLAVGFGTEGGSDYWLIKNSWGAGWGDNGYIKFKRGDNECQINRDVTFFWPRALDEAGKISLLNDADNP